jgi:triosephosphate isomerase
MSGTGDSRRLLAVNLKGYLGAAETAGWVGEVARRLPAPELRGDVELAVLPSFPSLERARRELVGVGVAIGAQDVSALPGGPHTGEVPAAMLAELGCRYVAVGHAERRHDFDESDALVAAKVAAAADHDLVPIICVGETDRDDAAAAATVVEQALAALARASAAEVVVAYEPVWAIGAEDPAPADHVLEVGAALREVLDPTPHEVRLIYGGSAGPGTLAPLIRGYDGLFLGRRAHRVDGLLEVLGEALELRPPVHHQGRSR